MWFLLPMMAQPAPAQEPAPEEPAPAELPIVQGPQIVEYVEAPYPAEAQELGIEAVVTLQIELSAEGEVEALEVVTPQGHGFDEAAVDAVLQMVFSPAQTAQGPVPVVFEFEYGFELRPVVPLTPEEDVPPPLQMDGVVLQMATRTPLAGVSIAVVDSDIVTTTDEDGRFEIRGAPLGEVVLRLLHTGHATEEKRVEVSAGEVAELKLWLRAEAYRDNEVVAVYERVKDEVTRRTITIEEVRRVPGTFGDPIKVIQTLPGAARTPFGTGFLIIRGADPEDSGVYIDGIRVPIIYHLTGTTSVLSPDLIDSVDYLPGGYSVKYGRTMGGTVDITTKDTFSEDGKLVWGTDILDSQVYYETSLGKNKRHGVAVGARRSYIDQIIPLFLGDSEFVLKPRYWDYQLKWASKFDDGNKLSSFVYGSDDLLQVSTPDDVAQGSDQDTQGALQLRYSSHRWIGRWQARPTDALRIDLTPSIGLDGVTSGVGDAFTIKSDQLVSQVRGEMGITLRPEIELVPGVDLISGFWNFDLRSAVSFEIADDPLAEREPVGFDGRGSFWSVDPFVRLNLRPLADSDRWLISPGLRYVNYALITGGTVTGDGSRDTAFTQSLDPRILTRLSVIEDKFAVKAATGLYHQPPQPQEALGIGTESTVGFEQAWSTSLGWEHRLSQALHYDVDVFYRKLDRLVVQNPDFTAFGDPAFFNGGDGRAYGLEVIARHDPVGRFFGWVSYTLSRATRRDPGECVDEEAGDPENRLLGTGPCWFPFGFDQTHIFSAQGGYDLPHDFGVSAQVQYVTGNPSTAFNAGVYDADSDFYQGFRIGGLNAGDRLPPFFQTSLRFDKLWTFKRWQLDTYVDLLNTVRGVNPEFTLYNYDFTEAAYVRGLPFIPNIGIEAKFHL